jgi:hypothetical protein
MLADKQETDFENIVNLFEKISIEKNMIE